VLAPVYRLLGQTAFSLEVGTVIVHLVAIALVLWCGWTVGGRAGLVVAAVTVAVLTRGYGPELLIQPWNPYLPLTAWMLTLAAAVAVLAGHHRWLLAVVLAGSFCAQTHIPYLLLGIGMCGLSLSVVGFRAFRAGGAERLEHVRVLLWSAGAGVLAWLAPLVEQFFGAGTGNMSRLIDHFGSPPETPLGYGDALSTTVRHLDVWNAWEKVQRGAELQYAGFDLRNPSLAAGVTFLLLWAVAACYAAIYGSRTVRAMHAVAALGMLLMYFSIARIFGTPWFYLTLWAWGISAVATVALLATVVEAARRWLPAPRVLATRAAALAPVALGVGAVTWSTVGFAADATDAQHPDEDLSTMVGALVGPTYEAVADGVGAATGADARYIFRWDDAQFFGSQAYGLFSELERRGLDVGGDYTFHVPLTDHRIYQLGGDPPPGWPSRPVADAEIHLATGVFVNQWRERADAVEVATYDPRTPDDRRQYAELREKLIDQLRDAGVEEAIPVVDTNLFGLSNFGDEVPLDARFTAMEMLGLGTEVAVFVAPSGGG
jgi:hypothetical protein